MQNGEENHCQVVRSAHVVDRVVRYTVLEWSSDQRVASSISSGLTLVCSWGRQLTSHCLRAQGPGIKGRTVM